MEIYNGRAPIFSIEDALKLASLNKQFYSIYSIFFTNFKNDFKNDFKKYSHYIKNDKKEYRDSHSNKFKCETYGKYKKCN